MCVMRIFIIFFIFNLITAHCALTKYIKPTLNDDESDIKMEIWGPLLEEWVTAPHRESRVMYIPFTDNTISIQRRIMNESKIITTPLNPVVRPLNKKPPAVREVSETDLYLLGAIEKLVYRVDFMEKRLRRMEEMMYYVMAGNRVDQEPCPNNFTRVGPNCYLFWVMAGREYDWKASNKYCKKQGGHLAELETIEENQDIIAHIQRQDNLRGKDYWTGGLNPGLLWIWSNSARPVNGDDKNTTENVKKFTILGDGRCLKLGYDPALRSYNYRGSDCGIRHSFICELPERSASNEIRKIGKNKDILSSP